MFDASLYLVSTRANVANIANIAILASSLQVHILTLVAFDVRRFRTNKTFDIIISTGTVSFR